MKRLGMGIVVLAVLLGLGIGLSCAFAQAHGPSSEYLQQANLACEAGDWDRAADLFVQAQRRWEDHRHFTAAFADHSPMEEIDGLFARLETCLRHKDSARFPMLCAQLAALLEAMADSHRLRWWTLL